MPPANDPYKTTQAPEDTYPEHAERNNSKGTLEDLGQNALERFKIREICEGWPVYRDAAEWRNYRSMVSGPQTFLNDWLIKVQFHDDAYIATSWKQGTIDEFIKASIEVCLISVGASDDHAHPLLGLRCRHVADVYPPSSGLHRVALNVRLFTARAGHRPDRRHSRQPRRTPCFIPQC
jgi:hypothetical protein